MTTHRGKVPPRDKSLGFAPRSAGHKREPIPSNPVRAPGNTPRPPWARSVCGKGLRPSRGNRPVNENARCRANFRSWSISALKCLVDSEFTDPSAFVTGLSLIVIGPARSDSGTPGIFPPGVRAKRRIGVRRRIPRRCGPPPAGELAQDILRTRTSCQPCPWIDRIPVERPWATGCVLVPLPLNDRPALAAGEECSISGLGRWLRIPVAHYPGHRSRPRSDVPPGVASPVCAASRMCSNRK